MNSKHSLTIAKNFLVFIRFRFRPERSLLCRLICWTVGQRTLCSSLMTNLEITKKVLYGDDVWCKKWVIPAGKKRKIYEPVSFFSNRVATVYSHSMLCRRSHRCNEMTREHEGARSWGIVSCQNFHRESWLRKTTPFPLSHTIQVFLHSQSRKNGSSSSIGTFQSLFTKMRSI